VAFETYAWMFVYMSLAKANQWPKPESVGRDVYLYKSTVGYLGTGGDDYLFEGRWNE